MISDAERSKIAQKLREDMELCVSGGHYCIDSEVIRYLCGVLGFRCSECRKSWKCLETLADLISPDDKGIEFDTFKPVESDGLGRDALLALAKGLDSKADDIIRAAQHARFSKLGPTMGEAKHEACEWRGIARRIREALGVQDAEV